MQKVTPRDIFLMRRALELARTGGKAVRPNPQVGAVLAKGGRVLAEAAHRRFGGPHAEVSVLARKRRLPAGCTLYVTLEPCAHFGKTPPCVDLILKSKIRKVVVGAKDPNPLVSGRGLRRLRRGGVRVLSGVLENECRQLNKAFNHWIRKKTPFVTLKVAQSLDGKIATATGQSRWITGPRSRALGHALRAQADAVLVGVNTVLRDDPLLSVRTGKTGLPLTKIILDSCLRTPWGARLFSKASPGRVVIVTTRRAPAQKRKRLAKKAQVLVVKDKNGRPDFAETAKQLGRMGILHLLIEGGGEVSASALSAGLVNEVYFFVAPKIIGGKASPGSVGGEGAALLSRAFPVKGWQARPLGKDLLIYGTL